MAITILYARQLADNPLNSTLWKNSHSENVLKGCGMGWDVVECLVDRELIQKMTL